MSFNNQTSVSVYSQNAGITQITKGAYFSAVAPGTNTLNGPFGPFKLGNFILTAAGSLYYLQSTTTLAGVTSATWTLLQTSGGGGGTLPVPSGGTGSVSLTAHGVLLGEGTSPIVASSAGIAGQAFVSGGPSADGAYGVTGVVGGGTGVTTLTGLALGTGTSGFMAVPYTTITAWTPNLQINGSSTGITYSTPPTGFYQTVGAVVSFTASINLSSIGASVGVVTISNLPVVTGTNATNNVVTVVPSTVTNTATYTDVYGSFTNSSTVLSFNQSGSGAPAATLGNTNLANNSSLFISGQYFTN